MRVYGKRGPAPYFKGQQRPGLTGRAVAPISAAAVQFERQPAPSRTSLTFRAVNRRDEPGYEPGLQRHHLLPYQMLTTDSFGPLVNSLGLGRVGFDDFRRNGLLLPAHEDAARLLGLPLHRGPHRSYNAMVLERVGMIEERWSREKLRASDAALDEALFRLSLLQSALRRRLLAPQGRAMVLNRRDPSLEEPVTFDDLDTMAELLWVDTAEAV